MTCKNCGESYGPEYDTDFKNGICEPCQFEIWWKKQEKKQILEYNQVHGTDYKDFQDVYNACWEDKVKREDLKKYKLMKEIYDLVVSNKAEYERCRKEEEEYHKNKTLFDEDREIPF